MRKDYIRAAVTLPNGEADPRSQVSMRALAEVVRLLSKSASPSDLCRAAVELGRGKLGFDRISIWLHGREPGLLLGTFGIDEAGVVRDESGLIVRANRESFIEPILEYRQSVVHLADYELRDHKGHVVGVGEHAQAALWDGETVVGVLCIDNLFSKRPIASNDLELLEQYALSIATLLALKRTEGRLRDSEERFRRLFQNAAVGMALVDLDGTVLEANSAICRTFGYDQEEAIGLKVFDLVHPEERPLHLENFISFVRTGVDVQQRERRCARKDGRTIWADISASLLTDASGAPSSIVAVIEDITAKRAALDTLAESEARFRILSESAPLGIFLQDKRGHCLYANNRFSKILGLAPEECLGLGWMKAVHLNDAERMRSEWRSMGEENAELSTEFRVVRPDGEIRTVSANSAIVWDEAGEIQGFVGTLDDLTEERATQEQLTRAQKLEGIGRLAGGIAHDFNNILTAILGYVDVAKAEAPPDDPTVVWLDKIRNASQRAAEITAQLWAFARRQEGAIGYHDLVRVVEDISDIIRRLISDNVELKIALPKRQKIVKAEHGQLHQLILNLAINASDAMPNGGVLTISVERAPKGQFVVLTVKDNGVGIEPEAMQRLFEPFYTTKESSSRAGMGLPTVYGIVQRCKGRIEIQSERGMGTTFSVYLPLEKQPLAKSAESVEGRTGFGTETILLAEDEPMVRDIAARALNAQGYRVLEAENGAQALEIHRTHEGTIDLLISDVVMPGISGGELAAEMLKERPGLKRLLISGYLDQPELETERAGPNATFLTKPFTAAKLVKEVRALLDE